MKSLFFCLSVLVLFSVAVQNGLGGGVGINMGIQLLEQVPLGENYLIKPTLVISNKSQKTNTYILSAIKPSTGLGVTLGYTDLPDLNWLSFEKREIKIAPNSSDSLRVYLYIPGQERYFNQHWSVYISVAGKPGGESISLALYAKLLIETESKQSSKKKIDGPLGLVPNVVKFENVQSGDSNPERKIRIHNNTHKKQVYQITILGEASYLDKRIYPSPEYRWIPDSSWIKISCGKPNPFRVSVGAGRNYTLRLKVVPPKDEKYKRWEGILLVESQEGVSNFVRVHIDPDLTGDKEK